MDIQKKPPLELSSWFKQPQGKDHPKGLATEAWKLCPGYLTIGGPGKAFQILMRISLDSQQPVFQICSKDDKASRIVFPLQNFEVMCGIEGRHSWNYALENLIQKFRTTCDFLQDWDKVAVYAFKALEEPISFYNGQHPDDKKRLSCWAYRLHDREDENLPVPAPQWLFPPTYWTKSKYASWVPKFPFFIDDHERRCRLIEPLKRERAIQVKQVEEVYSPGKLHRASLAIDHYDQSGFQYMFVRVGETSDDVPVNIPDICAWDRDQGEVIDSNGDAHLMVFLETTFPEKPEGEFLIATFIKPNVVSVDGHIKALDSVSSARSFGELQENIDQGNHGFSLERTMLAHGTELNPDHEHHFVLDAREIGTLLSLGEQQLSTEERDFRLEYIPEHFQLDAGQRRAFDASVTAITCSIHLTQGPPGTGKTTTCVAIVLALAALGHKVMLAGGANKGVDIVSEAVVNCLDRYPQILEWTGDLIRLRTLSRQLSEIRFLRAMRWTPALCDLFLRGGPGAPPSYVRLLHLIDEDTESALDPEQTKELKELYQEACSVLFSKTRIVATTLGNAANDLFRSGYEPVFLVCDEAGQCTEGGLAIALTLPSLRALILIGDPDQLPPTVISENLNNEGADYLKRSLMERLQKAEYPCTTLTSHYRSHPDILDFSNQQIYKGALVNMVPDRPTRVGYVWHEFTRSRHHFYQSGLENLRRVFISIDSIAVQKDSTSWSNPEQVEALCQFLRALYTFEAPNGMKIGAADVMIVTPYSDQRKLIRHELLEEGLEVHNNLSFDASQGQEAPLVFVLLTKPSADRAGIGILSNKHRLNVAFSRAEEVLIVFGNLRVWDTDCIDDWSLYPTTKKLFLVRFLADVSAKGHTLTWNGERTVTEGEAPKDFSDYPSHDWSRRGKRYYTSQIPVPPAPEPHETEATALALTAPTDTGDADADAESLPSVALTSSIEANTALTDPTMPSWRKGQWVRLLKARIDVLKNELDAGIDVWTGMRMTDGVRAKVVDELATLRGLMRSQWAAEVHREGTDLETLRTTSKARASARTGRMQ
ncbi:P-loop containing nucleoside triphosphate hydrolase protein [Aspergillus insuetus]